MDNVDFLEARDDVEFNEYHLESTPDDSYLSSPMESEPSIGIEVPCCPDPAASNAHAPEFQWNSFFEKPKTDILFDENKQPIQHYYIDPHIETAARYENSEWVFYRRNHLKVTASFEIDTPPKFVLGSAGALIPIDGIMMSIFGVSDFRGNFESVELFQTNAKREAKAAPAPQPIVPGKKICFSHLHFISGNESVRLCAYCSTGFVLRGGSPQSKRNGTGSDQNSGDGSSQNSADSLRYAKNPSKRRREEHETDEDHTPKMLSPVRSDVAAAPTPPSPTAVADNTPPVSPASAASTVSTVSAASAVSATSATSAASAVYTVHGRLGINTTQPGEALHVNGNALITGALYHPSDMRVKTGIRPLDTKKQLATIRQLKLYQYKLKSGSLCVPVASAVQHGVLAQEVARILPQAVVRTVGRVDEYALTGTRAGNGNLSELLAVDKDAIFMENVGATVELSKQFDDLSSKLETLDNKVEVLRPKYNESTKISFGTAVKLSITTLTKVKKVAVFFLCSLSLIFMFVAILTTVL